MKKNKLHTILLIVGVALFLATPTTRGESDTIYSFGNSDFSFGNNSARRYEYRYSDEKRKEIYKTNETGLRSNYIYAPAYSGREKLL